MTLTIAKLQRAKRVFAAAAERSLTDPWAPQHQQMREWDQRFMAIFDWRARWCLPSNNPFRSSW